MLGQFIQSVWYSRSRLTWILWPLSLPFLLLVLAKRAWYQLEIFKGPSFNKPIVVVGNLSVGGTGKTPFITSLASYLSSKNMSVGLVSRGYKADIKNFPHQVTEEDTAFSVGDESFMQFRKLSLPIVIAPKRADAVKYLLENNQVDVVISDDGLQHYSMERDLEIALFDGARQFGNKLILPFGPLREPITRLHSVDYVAQNGEQENKFTQHKVKLVEVSLVNISTKEEKQLNYLSEQEVVAIAGIGNPERFFASLEKFVTIKSKTVYPDHHAFSLRDFDHVHEDKLVVMTEKDAVKCESFAKKNWYFLKVEMQVESALLEQIEQSIISLGNCTESKNKSVPKN